LDRPRPIVLDQDRRLARDARKDVSHDSGGIFSPRIVISHNDVVRQFRGNVTHQWTLAGVAIAAAAKHDAEPSPAV
jgi:hypothetical protein